MSKGGSTTSNTQIPAWLENAAIENINKARDVSSIGYVPYYGPDVAAFSPMQQQSMQSTGNAASAFGLAPQGFDAMAGMPQAQTFAGGIQGYSSAPLYQQSLDQLQANRPAQYKAMTDMFIDPFTGAQAQGNYAATPTQTSQMFSNETGGGYVPPAPTTSVGSGGGSAYDSIYPQAGSGDLTGGDSFIGDDGNSYTVGYGEGQVDHGLANAAANNNGFNSIMSNSDAAAGIAGNLLDSSMFGQIYEGFTDNPLSGGSPNAVVSELDNSDVSGGLMSNVTTTGIPSANIISGGDYYGNGDQYAASLKAVQAAHQQKIAQDRLQAAADAEAAAQAYADEQAAAAQRMAAEQAAQVAYAQQQAALAAAVNQGGGGGGGNNTWSAPQNNGYAGQGGSTKGKAKTGYKFGL